MAIYRCRSCTADVLHNSKMRQNTGTTLSLFPASLSLVSVSPASLWVAEMGVSYCVAWCCQGFISSLQSETCLSKPCVRVCLCACRTISLAQQLQERAQNILFAPFPRQPVHEVLFCVRIWDACMCVCAYVSMPPADFAMLPTVSWREHDWVRVSVMIGESCLLKPPLRPLRRNNDIYVSGQLLCSYCTNSLFCSFVHQINL